MVLRSRGMAMSDIKAGDRVLRIKDGTLNLRHREMAYLTVVTLSLGRILRRLSRF
jgi:hypothetical protein